VNRNSLRPMYGNLTGEERFRLAVRAGASGDDQECAHLFSSCRRVAGTAMDPSFTGPTQDSFRLAWAFARACGPYLGHLVAIETLEGLLTGENGRTILDPRAAGRVGLVLARVAQGAARDLRAMVDAFEEVCQERAGLSSSDLLRFWAPEVEAGLQAAEEWINELEADPRTRDEFKAGLDHIWTLAS
jgi:hypothetical protein